MKNQNNFALFWGLNLFALLIACGKEPQRETVVPQPPLATAQQTKKQNDLRASLPEKAATIGLRELQRLSSTPSLMAKAGFSSLEEIGSAHLGKPILANVISCGVFSKKGIKSESITPFLNRTQWLFPVLVDEKIRSAVYVDSLPENGEVGDWIVTSLGDAGLMRAYDSARVRFDTKANSSGNLDIYLAPGAGLGFVATGTQSKDFVLPLTGSKPLPNLEKINKPITWKEMQARLGNSKLVQAACSDTLVGQLPPGAQSTEPKP